MDAKHTPGPWVVSNRLNSIGDPKKGGRYVILQQGQSKREDFFIAEMPFAACRAVDEREHESNARLIAAAPEMLAALKLVMTALRDGAPVRCGGYVAEAIAKAEPAP